MKTLSRSNYKLWTS